MRILSVDWDFFFPELSFDSNHWMLYDWGHRDSGSFFLDHIWYNRAAGFIQNNMPLPGATGEEKTFWNRFKFRSHSKLYISESHVEIYNPDIQNYFHWSGSNRIDNFDAHHDAGYRGDMNSFLKEGKVTCENWALAYHHHGVTTRTIYPTWKTWAKKAEQSPVYKLKRTFDKGQSVATFYDHVFVCRSGGWTPPWLDDAFEAFIKACPIQPVIELQPCANRNWDTKRLDAHIDMWKQAMEMRP